MNVGELLVKLGVDMADFRRGMGEVRNEVSVTNKVLDGLKTTIAGVVTGVGIAGAWKWLVSGNAQMEQYRQTLNIVMKDTQKAGELLEWATKFAAKTPFEIPEIVESTVRLQAYGIEARNVLGDLGDMAAAMGKPLTQAMEALADAQTGELERLKEFGITKDMLIQEALELGKGEIVNAKGQITDLQAMNDTLIAIIRERYHGAMEAQSTTLNGMISNIKDWLGTAGRILGENIFEKVKAQLQDLLVSLNNLSESDKLEKWGERIGNVFAVMINWFKLMNEHANVIIPLISGIVAGFMTYGTAVGVIKAVALTQAALNAVMAANLISILVLAIGVLIAAGVALYRNWDTIKAKAQELWSGIQVGFNQLKQYMISLGEALLALWDKIGKGIIVISSGITGLLLPKLTMLAAQSLITGAKVAASWLSMAASAVKSTTIQAVQAIPVLLRQFIALALTAMQTAKRVVIAWTTMAVQAMAQAARMALAWVIAMGPIGWVSGAFLAFTALIVSKTKWMSDTIEKIKEKIIGIFSEIAQVFDQLKAKLTGDSNKGKKLGVGDFKQIDHLDEQSTKLQDSISDINEYAQNALMNSGEVNTLSESFGNLGSAASDAGGKASKAAEDTRTAWEKAADRLGVGLQILQAEYDIAAAKLDDNATESDKLALKSAHLSNQLEMQKQIVAAVNKGYDQSVASKGATAEEIKKLELRLVQEKKAQAELEKEIRSTNSAIEEQGRKMKELTKNVQEVAGKYRQDLTRALEDYQKKVADVNKKLADDEAKLTQEYQKSVDSRAKSLMDWVGLFDTIPEPKAVSGQDLLGNLDNQVNAFRDWQKNLQALAGRGIDDGLISELEQMGPKASSEIAALNSLTNDELQQYVLLWQEKSSLARSQATSELTGLKAETQAKIAELRADAAAQLAEYAQEWEDKNREIRENTVKELEKLVEEAEKLGAAFAAALTGAISTALPDLAGNFIAPDTDQAGEAADQHQGVVGEAKAQAVEHASIVQNELSSLLQYWTDAGSQLSSKQNEIKTQSITTWQEILQRLDALWKKMNADLVKGWTDNRNFIYDILGQVDTRFKATENAATNWGRNLMANYISGIRSMQGQLTETLLAISMEVENYLGFHSPTKKGPGKDADTWAPNLVQMLSSGIQDELPLIQAASEQLMEAIRTPVVNIQATSPAVAVAGGAGSIGPIYITGSNAEEIWEQLERKLHRLGVRW